MTQTAAKIEQEIKDTLEEGVDIYRKVRSITLKALTEHELDLDNIQRVIEAVFKGMSESIGDQYEPAKEAFQESVAALDDALEKTAQASKLAVEEAASRINEFSKHDLHQAMEDIKSLEDMFLDTMEKFSYIGSDTFIAVASDFINHAHQNGTAVGQQVRIALDALNKFRRRGQETLLSEAAATTSILSKIGSGILAGIAESLEAKKPG